MPRRTLRMPAAAPATGKPGGARGASVGVVIVAGDQWTGVVGFLKGVSLCAGSGSTSVGPLIRSLGIFA